jgi:hypothetical protein
MHLFLIIQKGMRKKREVKEGKRRKKNVAIGKGKREGGRKRNGER